MADATQVQIRRDTATNLALATPALAELGYDQTNERLLVGNGVQVAGIPHASFNDARNGNFIRGTVGGSANALTLTMTPPPISYATGMRIGFIASSNNTGSATINVNGLGIRTMQKFSGSSLTNLASGDLVSGVYYEAVYTGTIFQLVTLYQSGLTSVGQGNLRTSTGTISQTYNTANSGKGVQLILPGGMYGFIPMTSVSSLSNSYPNLAIGRTGQATGFALGAFFQWTGQLSGTNTTVSAQQRYITSSPPFDIGDGEAGGFFFALVDSDKNIVSTYIADVPPWAYNGKTNITADRQCPVSGKKFRIVPKKRTLEQIMDGAPLEFVEQEICQKVKNADMGDIPHPFGEVPDGHHVVLLDPMDDRIRKLVDFQNSGGSDEVADYIAQGKFQIGDECKRCCPKGVHTHKMKYKYTSKF